MERYPSRSRRATEADPRAAADLWLRARGGGRRDSTHRPHDDDDVRAWFAAHVVRDIELWVAEDRAGALGAFWSWKGDGLISST